MTYPLETTKSQKSFVVIKSDSHNSVIINSKTPIMEDIRPELPNLLTLPENFTNSDAHWIKEINQSGNYLTSNGSVKYYITGSSDFTHIGRKKIVTKSGTFNCIGIKQEINYTLKKSFKPKMTTTDLVCSGFFKGENWIEPKNGILISSSFDNHQIISINLTDSNRGGVFGFEKVYREIPFDYHISTELIKIRDPS